MAAEPIPADLLTLARGHAAAMAATRSAARGGGDVVAATTAEARIARELHAYRAAHPEWASSAAQTRVREAAVGEG